MWIAPQVDVTMIHAAGEEIAKPVGCHDGDHKGNHQLQGARQLEPQNHLRTLRNHRNGNQLKYVFQ